MDPNALAALKALSEGGSPALNAYRQSQSAEQANRVNALNQVLGGDPAKFIADQQARYAATQNVPLGGTDFGQLGQAADGYIAQERAKLQDDYYQAQQSLGLSKASLDQKAALQAAPTEQERLQMLEGAARTRQENEYKAASEAGSPEKDSAYAIEKDRDVLRNAVDQADAQVRAAEAAVAQNPGGAVVLPTPDGAAPIGNAGDLATARTRQQQAQQALTAFDAEARNRVAALSQALGIDAGQANGVLDQYLTSNGIDRSGLYRLLGTANDQQAEAVARRQREVEMSLPAYERELAGAFGVDPLRAKAMFPDNDGASLTEAGNRAKTRSYVTGELSNSDQAAAAKDEQDAQDWMAADALGFDDPTALKALRRSARVDNEDIANTLNSPIWRDIDGLANAYIAGYWADGAKPAYLDAGAPGFTQELGERLQQQGVPAEDAARYIKIADAYYGNRLRSVRGSARDELG